MSDIDFDRITNPLRVVTGSHPDGTGYGCAMNVVSYITGDTVITDLPACSNRYLAEMIQLINDTLGARYGSLLFHDPWPVRALRPEDAMTVIRLGCLTIGTGALDEEELIGRYLLPPLCSLPFLTGIADTHSLGKFVKTSCAFGHLDSAISVMEKVLRQIRKDYHLDDVTVPANIAKEVEG